MLFILLVINRPLINNEIPYLKGKNYVNRPMLRMEGAGYFICSGGINKCTGCSVARDFIPGDRKFPRTGMPNKLQGYKVIAVPKVCFSISDHFMRPSLNTRENYPVRLSDVYLRAKLSQDNPIARRSPTAFPKGRISHVMLPVLTAIPRYRKYSGFLMLFFFNVLAGKGSVSQKSTRRRKTLRAASRRTYL